MHSFGYTPTEAAVFLRLSLAEFRRQAEGLPHDPFRMCSTVRPFLRNPFEGLSPNAIGYTIATAFYKLHISGRGRESRLESLEHRGWGEPMVQPATARIGRIWVAGVLCIWRTVDEELGQGSGRACNAPVKR